ncbi:hypothetical protein [Pseudarthrobacter sp. S9]|uniref:hypothetical protein n=1 Tax=Pseudarthrobacter sp. S9 TaxID=3418421 RepID=UPI003D093740
MTGHNLLGVVSEIINLLKQCGRADKAAWLQERVAVLEARDAVADAREYATNELHGVVLGMGGLMDLSLVPEPGSAYSSESARERLDELADILYDLTR